MNDRKENKMAHELTDRHYMQQIIIPWLQNMMVADWDNFEDPRLSAEEMYTQLLDHLNPPE